MPKLIDLKYASHDSTFFTFFNHAKSAVREFIVSKSPKLRFNAKDEGEIARGFSYAFFPELKDLVQNGRQLTFDDVRRSLSQRGIDDIAFQNRILMMLIQNKVCLQFGLYPIFNALFAEFKLIAKESQLIETLEVNHAEEICYSFKNSFYELDEGSQINLEKPAIELSFEIKITPEKVELISYQLKQLFDSPNVREAYAAVQAEQQNILMQWITYIKYLLGFASELIVEEQKDHHFDWASCSQSAASFFKNVDDVNHPEPALSPPVCS